MLFFVFLRCDLIQAAVNFKLSSDPRHRDAWETGIFILNNENFFSTEEEHLCDVKY